MSACHTCGCTLQQQGKTCPACDQDACGEKAMLYAGHLRELAVSFAVNPTGKQYVPALNAAICALQNERQNHRYVARILRRPRTAPTTQKTAHAAN